MTSGTARDPQQQQSMIRSMTRITHAISALLIPILLAACSVTPTDSAQDSRGVAAVALALTETDAAVTISAEDEAAFALASSDPTAAAKRIAALTIANRVRIAMHAEFRSKADCDAFKVSGAHVLDRFDRWADLLVEAKPAVLQAITKSRGILKIDVAGQRLLPPPPIDVRVTSRATPESIVRGGVTKLTGKGVAIAIVDSGIDFRHPDFITKDASGRPVSRILAFWDTTQNHKAGAVGRAAPIRYPNAVSVGTVYTRDELTVELRASKKRIGITDANGHGTACASIAAGNGTAHKSRRYTGVAPEAEIIGVRIGGSSGMALPNAYLLGAICSWIDDVAGSMPCVVSCSFGGQVGPRDGTRVVERQLDARFLPATSGRVICFAAGNDGKQSLHANLEMSATQADTLRWTVPAGKTARVSIHLDEERLSAIQWELRGPTIIPQQKVVGSYNRFSKKCSWVIPSPAGSYVMRIKCKSQKTVTADAYITAPGEFIGTNARPGSQISTPGTCTNAITVGSYDFNDQLQLKNRLVAIRPSTMRSGAMTVGAISGYSNPGPRRDGLQKPELAAPGQYHVAAATLQPMPADKRIPREATGLYRAFNGTSAATPYCAGVIALMFEKNPELTGSDVRRILTSAVTSDRHTGTTPNALWGHGKLDLAAVRRALQLVPAAK